MAISVTTKTDNVVGNMRMTCGTITSTATTEATFDCGLTTVDSIQINPSPALAVTTSGGTVTMTPVITGVMYFTAFGY